MRFEEVSEGTSRVVLTTRVCGLVVAVLGLLPLAWLVQEATAVPLEGHHWVVAGLGLGVLLFGVAVFVYRRVVTFDFKGLTFAERKLWGCRVSHYERQQVEVLRLVRQVRGSRVTPFGVQARSVHYVVLVEFRGCEEPFVVFHSSREELAHRVAHSAARNLLVRLRDEVGDEPDDFLPNTTLALHLDDVSLVHAPPAVSIEGSGTQEVVMLRGRTPPKRRVVAVVEFLLFGTIAGFLACLFPTAKESWAVGLLALAVVFAALPALRVVAGWWTRERLFQRYGALRVERRAFGLRIFVRDIPLGDIVRVRLQTRDVTHYGLSILTRTGLCRVGAPLAPQDLVWLRAWIEAQIPRGSRQSLPGERQVNTLMRGTP